MANIQTPQHLQAAAGIPLRALGSRSGVSYSRICDAFRKWVTLRDEELLAIEQAIQTAIRERAEKYRRLAAREGVPV